MSTIVLLTRQATAPNWSFDVLKGQYRDNESGKLLSSAELRTAIEGVIDGAKTEAAALTKSMQSGETDTDEWKAAMLALILALHSLASAAAIGNVPGMLAIAEADLRKTLLQERTFLSRFADHLAVLAAGVTLGTREGMPDSTRRAQSYMDAALMTYERQRYMLHQFLGYHAAIRTLRPGGEHCDGCIMLAELGWVPIEQLVPLGHEQCGQFCECDVDYAEFMPSPHKRG